MPFGCEYRDQMGRSIAIAVLCSACTFHAPTSSQSSDAGGDGGGGDIDADTRPIGRCGTPGAITDGFSSANLARWTQTSSGGGLVAVANGELAVTSGTGGVTAVVSRSSVDLENAAAELGVVDIGDAHAVFRLAFDDTRVLGIEAQGGSLAAIVNGSVLATTTYSHDDRYWRISEAANTVTFETSVDRTAWRPIGTFTTPTYVTAVHLVVGTDGPAGGALPARFDGVNEGVASASWCKTAALVDTFDAVTVQPFGPLWNNSGITGTHCTESVSGGSAHSNQDGAGASDCWFASSTSYDLRAGSVSTYITTISNFTAGWRTYLSTRDDADRDVTIAFDNNEMCATGTNIARTCIAYASNLEYWRLREDAGTVYFEVSSDNASWIEVHHEVTQLTASAVRAQVGTITDAAIGQFIGLSISDINP